MARPLKAELPHEREQLRRLFLMKRTEVEMVQQRGFNIEQVYMFSTSGNYPVMDLSFILDPTLGMLPGEAPEESAYFLEMLQRRQQTGLFQTRQEFSSIYYTSDLQRRLAVFYLNNEPGKHVSKQYFSIVDTFITQHFKEMILVTTTGLNHKLSTRVCTRMPGYKVEVFLDAELAFNHTKHAYAPINVNHVKSKDVAEWGRQEGVQPEKLPMMLDTDIIAKWFGATPMDVFQMELMGATTDTIGYNRIVRMTPAKT